jgi:hypothetical protein
MKNRFINNLGFIVNLISITFVFFGWFSFMQLLGALTLLFFLPGISLLNLFGVSVFSYWQKGVLGVTISMAIVILFGLLLGFFNFITYNGWFITISLFNSTCFLFGSRRVEGTAPLLSKQTIDALTGASNLIFLLWGSLIVAIAICVSALDSANLSPFKYTELWIAQSPRQSGFASIGLHNAEGKDENYHVEVLVDNRLGKMWQNIAVRKGETWQATYERNGLAEHPRLEVVAYRAEDPNRVYRRAWLAAE